MEVSFPEFRITPLVSLFLSVLPTSMLHVFAYRKEELVHKTDLFDSWGVVFEWVDFQPDISDYTQFPPDFWEAETVY